MTNIIMGNECFQIDFTFLYDLLDSRVQKKYTGRFSITPLPMRSNTKTYLRLCKWAFCCWRFAGLADTKPKMSVVCRSTCKPLARSQRVGGASGPKKCLAYGPTADERLNEWTRSAPTSPGARCRYIIRTALNWKRKSKYWIVVTHCR